MFCVEGLISFPSQAANVLVNDRLRCVISDFGQSEMKSEAYRISGATPPRQFFFCYPVAIHSRIGSLDGTLRWQAPELMSGVNTLTTEMDVYAFGITCIEILSMGRLPWPYMDNDAVRYSVMSTSFAPFVNNGLIIIPVSIEEDSRPTIPLTRFSSVALQDLLRACWARDPFERPPFSKVVQTLKQLRKNTGSATEDIPSPRIQEWKDLEDHEHSRPSPDMHPIPLPGTTPRTCTLPIVCLNVLIDNVYTARDSGLGPAQTQAGTSPLSSDTASFRTAREVSSSPPVPSLLAYREDTVATTRLHMPEPVLYTPSGPASSRASSLFTSPPSSQSDENLNTLHDYPGYDSPPPVDERIANTRNERRYRLLLTHEFHPSRMSTL